MQSMLSWLLLLLALPAVSVGYTGPCTFTGYAGAGGICQQVSTDPNYHVAVGASVYNREQQCGRRCVRINYWGRTSVGPVADLCPECGTGIDISLTMFAELTGSVQEAQRLGRIQVSWEFVKCPCGRQLVGTPCDGNPGVSAQQHPCTKWGWRFHDGFDIVAHDWEMGSQAAGHRNECQQMCKWRPNCRGYSWASGVCYFKHGGYEHNDDALTANSNVYSATRCD